MRLAERIGAAYTAAGRGSLAVPEWGDDFGGDNERPLVVHWKPYTLADDDKAWTRASRDGSLYRLVSNEGYAAVVCHKAEDAAGNRLFDDFTDLPVLMGRTDKAVVQRVAQAIMASPGEQEFADRLERDGLRMNMFRVAERLGKTIEEIEALPMAKFIETLAALRRIDADRAS